MTAPAPQRTALVIGAAGQDGSYLCELLVQRGYDVTAVVRTDPNESVPNLDAIRGQIDLVQSDLIDTEHLQRTIDDREPRELYNFAAVSFGPDAWNDPARTAELGTLAITRLLETVRTVAPATRFFQASSSWVFGAPEEAPQSERTPYAPVEPYGAGKAYADFMIRAYRHRYGTFACSGIFYNHESPRRAEHFVTRKITRAAAAIKLGLQQELVLGDLEASRDWGFARDYVHAAWLMLQSDGPSDYVIATGESRAVRQFVEAAFSAVGLDWKEHTRVDPAFARGRSQVANLVGDAAALRDRLSWRPSVTFDELVRMMVEADLRDLSVSPGGDR